MSISLSSFRIFSEMTKHSDLFGCEKDKGILFEAISSRDFIIMDNFAVSFQQETSGYDKYIFECRIELYEYDLCNKNKGRNIASVHAIFFDEDRIIDDGEDIVIMAGLLDDDTHDAILTLTKSKVYKLIDECFIPFQLPHTGFLKILHVSPELSESGLALYILENIDHIVRCLFNINIIALVVCPKLKDLGHEGDWIYANDEDGTEQKRMVSLLRKTGFSKNQE